MGPEARVKVLMLCDPERAPHARPLAATLRASPAFELEETAEPQRLVDLRGVGAVYADWGSGPLTDAQARALSDFVRDGGGVVAVGATLTSWATTGAVVELAGWTPDGRTVDSELLVSPAHESARGFRVRDRVHLLSEPPAGSEPLLFAPWRYRSQVIAYDRRAGDGHFVYVGLGHDPATYGHDWFRNFVVASLRRAADAGASRSTVGVGLLGYGALGPAHAAALGGVDGLSLVAVCDRDPGRREAAAAQQVSVVETAEALLAREDVDLVLVALPPVAHAAAVMQALEAGKHVVCEKPFALRAADCDRMIHAAASRDLLLTVFQNRRWDPDFVAARDVLRSGAIGAPFYMESFVGGHAHPCSYWHSHEPISGGAIFDWGSHYVDWILQLFDARVAAVRCVTHKRVWHDVTNADHTTLEIVFDGGQQAFFIHSDVSAAAKPKWYVLGTEGALVGDWRHTTERVRGPDGEIDERRVLPTDLPARVSVLRPDGEGGSHREVLSLPRRDRAAFYRNLVGHLRHGEPIAVAADDARRNVAVMEAATTSASRGGALVALSV